MKSIVSNRLGLLRALCLLTALSLAGVPTPVFADLTLNSDWKSPFGANGRLLPDDEIETRRLAKAALVAAQERSPRLLSARSLEFGFKMRLGSTLYYLQPVLFMSKQTPDEVCTPDRSPGARRYSCKEGQRRTNDCHVFFFDRHFAEVGHHRVRIDEGYPFFCNAVPAIGTADKARNQLLITVQYFPIDRELARAAGEIGDGWMRMTVLLQLREENGKLLVEQDDACLGNPNRIETIAEARNLLLRCADASH